MIAIIPARGGSKRIPKKNIKEFLGIPIMQHTIQLIDAMGKFDRIVVTTDDPEIAHIANKSGAEILIRNADLADDFTTTVDVMSDAVEKLGFAETEVSELICCIYPVNPNLNPERIAQAVKLMDSEKLDYVFTAKKFESSPGRALKIGMNGFSEMFFPANLNKRSQDLPDYYQDAAMFYLGKSKAWYQKRPVLYGKSKFLILDKYETMDIDDEDDWIMMERIYSAKFKSHE